MPKSIVIVARAYDNQGDFDRAIVDYTKAINTQSRFGRMPIAFVGLLTTQKGRF